MRLLLEIARASRTQEPRKQTTFKATCLYFLLPLNYTSQWLNLSITGNSLNVLVIREILMTLQKVFIAVIFLFLFSTDLRIPACPDHEHFTPFLSTCQRNPLKHPHFIVKDAVNYVDSVLDRRVMTEVKTAITTRLVNLTLGDSPETC